MSMEPGALFVPTPFGELEVLFASAQNRRECAPILYVHGANCSAHCFSFLLSATAQAGHPSYALSLRGHGRSWTRNPILFHLLTGIDSYVHDVQFVLEYVRNSHSTSSIVLVGHSMGATILQRALNVWTQHVDDIGGLILLCGGPLYGGGWQIAKNWIAAGKGIPSVADKRPSSHSKQTHGWKMWYRLFSQLPQLKSGLDTSAEIRARFFSREASDETIDWWMRKSRSRIESIRVAIEMLFPIGNANRTLDALTGVCNGRELLCVAANRDRLVPPSMVRRNVAAYQAVPQDGGGVEERVMFFELKNSAHHVMLDIQRDTCGLMIVDWIRGKDLYDIRQ